MPPLACGWEWLPERKGLVTGIILGAFGFSSFIFSPIAQAIVNPGNLKPEELDDGRIVYSAKISSNVPKMFRLMCLCLLCLGFIAVVLVRRNPQF